MDSRCDQVLRSLLRDETLTRDLGDEEARMLVDWVVELTESHEIASNGSDDALSHLHNVIRKAKAINRFVYLWNRPASRGAAAQLAAVERFTWPLPTHEALTSADLMERILNWERSIR